MKRMLICILRKIRNDLISHMPLRWCMIDPVYSRGTHVLLIIKSDYEIVSISDYRVGNRW